MENAVKVVARPLFRLRILFSNQNALKNADITNLLRKATGAFQAQSVPASYTTHGVFRNVHQTFTYYVREMKNIVNH